MFNLFSILSKLKKGSKYWDNYNKKLFYLVPNRVWTINELSKEELADLRREIDFSHKKDCWWEQEPLKSLDLSSNSLIALGAQIKNMLDLTFLDVRITFNTYFCHANMKMFFTKMSVTTRNNEKSFLQLHDNLLESLPPEIGDLNNLRKLNISFNKLENLPLEFYKLIELRQLDLKSNILRELDPSIGDLIMLESLVCFLYYWTGSGSWL